MSIECSEMTNWQVKITYKSAEMTKQQSETINQQAETINDETKMYNYLTKMNFNQLKTKNYELQNLQRTT